MIHLAVKKARLDNRSDIDFTLQPIRTFPGHPFLLEAVGQQQGVLLDPESFFFCSVRVKGLDKSGFSEQEPKMMDRFELFLQGGIGVNGEISGNEGEIRALADLFFEKITDRPTMVVVPDAGCFKAGERHKLSRKEFIFRFTVRGVMGQNYEYLIPLNQNKISMTKVYCQSIFLIVLWVYRLRRTVSVMANGDDYGYPVSKSKISNIE